MKWYPVYFIASLVFIVGCGKWTDPYSSDSNEESKQQVSNMLKKNHVEPAAEGGPQNPSFKPFYIYADKGTRDNHYVASGFMPNGKCLQFMDAWTEDCFSGSTCIKTVFDVACAREDQGWAGIYWLNPPNNWGSKKGGFDLTGATKLTFWAKGENGGEQIEEFKIGGIEGKYPDSDLALIGPVILSNKWKKYSIDLRGKDLSYISGGFSWSATEEMNPDSCTFYLDEIRFE